MFYSEDLHKTGDSFSGGFKLNYLEKTHPLKGEFWVILKDSEGFILAKRHGSNIIVNSASVLIARLLKDNSEPSGGITYLAMGTGAVGWNLQNPPQPTTSQTTLEAEIARKALRLRM